MVFEKRKIKKSNGHGMGRAWAGHRQGMGRAWAGHGQRHRQGLGRAWAGYGQVIGRDRAGSTSTNVGEWLKTLMNRKKKTKEKNNKPNGVAFEKRKKKKAKGMAWAGQ